jgi:hypothetical protein
LRNIDSSVGQRVALGFRSRRELTFHQPTLGEQALLLCNIKREVLWTGKDIDAQPLIGPCLRRQRDRQRQRDAGQ